MMKEQVQSAINDQIRAEFQSAYTYLAMAARMEAANLRGMANWLRVQWEEEVVHGMKLYDFVLQRGGDVELHGLSAPDPGDGTPLQLFEAVLEMERDNTRRIHALYDLAVSEADYALQTLLHWFIDEQVEEEDIASDIIDKLRLIGDSGPSLFLLDQEMGQRQLGEEA
jgi:ferritin